MLRATGCRGPLMPWTRRRQLRPAGPTFTQGPIRLAAATAVVGLLLGNAVLVYELTHEDAGPVRQETTSPPDLQSAASDLQRALEAVEAEIRADVGGLTVRYGETSDRRSRTQESPARGGAGSASQPRGDGTASTSDGPSLGGSTGESTSTESDTGAGSGGSSGGTSDGGDTSDNSSSGSSGGSSSGSGSDTGDTDAGTGGTGGAGGGGGSDASGGGDVSAGGGSGGGGGG